MLLLNFYPTLRFTGFFSRGNTGLQVLRRLLVQVASLVELSREGVPYTYVVSRLHVRSLTCSWPLTFVVSREGVPFTYVVSRDGARPTRARPWTFELEDSFHLRLLACAGTVCTMQGVHHLRLLKRAGVIIVYCTNGCFCIVHLWRILRVQVHVVIVCRYIE